MAKTKQPDKVKINDYTSILITQDSVMSKLNCHNIGRILEFDPDTQLCTVEIMQIKQHRNKLFSPVPITNVPLLIYGAKNGHITLPNPEGTICLLFFLDRNIDNFLETGEQYTPSTTRMHDMTDCIALTTFKTLANPLENYDERAISIFNKEVIEEIIYDSYIKVYGNQILFNSTDGTSTTSGTINPQSITISTTATTLNSEETVDITTSDLTIESDNSTINAQEKIALSASDITEQAEESIELSTSLGASIKMDGQIELSNTTYNLLTLIQSLITTIENISTTQGDAVSSSSKDALSAVSTQFAGLLK